MHQLTIGRKRNSARPALPMAVVATTTGYKFIHQEYYPFRYLKLCFADFKKTWLLKSVGLI